MKEGRTVGSHKHICWHQISDASAKIGSPEFRLFVFAPNGQQQCAGEYVMLPDRANRQAVWEQKNGNFWIYSGAKFMTSSGTNTLNSW